MQRVAPTPTGQIEILEIAAYRVGFPSKSTNFALLQNSDLVIWPLTVCLGKYALSRSHKDVFHGFVTKPIFQGTNVNGDCSLQQDPFLAEFTAVTEPGSPRSLTTDKTR